MAELTPLAPYAGLPRLVRGSCVGGLATGLAAGGHVIAGGESPQAAAIIVTGLLAAYLCVVMSGLEWTMRRLVGVLLVAQAGFHLVFVATTPSHHAANASVMAGWHIAATALTIVLVRYAECALADLVELVALHRTSLLFGSSLKVCAPTRLTSWLVAARPGPTWQRSLTPVRGPPLLS